MLFEDKQIRKCWIDNKWYFSITDVIYVLTGSIDPSDYWYKLKKRVSKEEQIELSTICRELKLEAKDGKKYKTCCADTEGILRIIQSIPSPKVEPFKKWLAKVGSERIDEINNPELALDRMRKIYEKKGYSKQWIEQREKGIVVRHNLTDEWKYRGVNNKISYAILTNEIYKSGFGLSAKEYKKIKKLNDWQNLRDSMSNIELALTNLAETTSIEFHKHNDSIGINELKNDVNKAGNIMNNTKKDIEEELNHSIITSTNYNELTKNE